MLRIMKMAYVMEKGNYINGKKHGDWEVFDNKGILVSSAFLKDGKISGDLKIYNSQGELMNKIEYENIE